MEIFEGEESQTPLKYMMGRKIKRMQKTVINTSARLKIGNQLKKSGLNWNISTTWPSPAGRLLMTRSRQLERAPAVTSTMLQRASLPEISLVARAMITARVKTPARMMKGILAPVPARKPKAAPSLWTFVRLRIPGMISGPA